MNAGLYNMERLVNSSKVATDKSCHITDAIFLPYCTENHLIIFE